LKDTADNENERRENNSESTTPSIYEWASIQECRNWVNEEWLNQVDELAIHTGEKIDHKSSGTATSLE